MTKYNSFDDFNFQGLSDSLDLSDSLNLPDSLDFSDSTPLSSSDDWFSDYIDTPGFSSDTPGFSSDNYVDTPGSTLELPPDRPKFRQSPKSNKKNKGIIPIIPPPIKKTSQQQQQQQSITTNPPKTTYETLFKRASEFLSGDLMDKLDKTENKMIDFTLHVLEYELHSGGELLELYQKNINKVTNNLTYKSPNYKIGYEKRYNIKIYNSKDPDKFEMIYKNAKDDVYKLYHYMFHNPNAALRKFKSDNDFYIVDNNVITYTDKYLEGIYNDYKNNRGNCQEQTKDGNFQIDESGNKYIYSNQMLRYNAFTPKKASDARKGLLKLDNNSARLKSIENDILTNVKLFIFENGDDQDMKQWYANIPKNMQGISLNSYNNLKKDWNTWKSKNNEKIEKITIKNNRVSILNDSKTYKNFDEFLKDKQMADNDLENVRQKLLQIYGDDLSNFLRVSHLTLEQSGAKYLVSRYDLKRKNKVIDDVNNVTKIVDDDNHVLISLPTILEKHLKNCSKGYRRSREIGKCNENKTKTIGLIKYSKPQRKSPKYRKKKKRI